MLGGSTPSAATTSIFASNTSQFSISKLAAATGAPDRVIGSHWFNPPPLMAADRGHPRLETSDETLGRRSLSPRATARRRSSARRTRPGFITSRLIASSMVEAARIVEEGIAEMEDVDKACRLGFGHAMGPLRTADLSGLDVVEFVADNLARNYGDRFLAPQGPRARER